MAQLPRFQVSAPNLNALFQPLQSGLNTYRQGMDRQTTFAANEAQRARANALANSRLGLQREQVAQTQDYRNRNLAQNQQQFEARQGLDRQRLDDGRRKQRLQQAAGIVQMIQGQQDPAQRTAMYQRLLQSDPDLGRNVQGLGTDEGLDWILGRARGYVDPAQQQLMQAKIAKARGGGGISDNLQKGWYWNPETQRAEPIPGSKDDRFSGEQGSRLGLVQSGVRDMPRIREIAQNMGSAINPATQGYFAGRVGELGELQRLIEGGSEGILRALTGAAAQKEEVARLAGRYTPLPSDTLETRMQKLDLFERDMRSMLELGSGTATKTQMGQFLNETTPDDAKSRLKAKYGLE